MNDKKYLIVTAMNNNYFFPYVKTECIDVVPPYITGNRFQLLDMKIRRKFGFDYRKYTFMKNGNKQYAGILMFDCACDVKNLKLIRELSGNVNLFIWNVMDDFLGRLKAENYEINVDYIKSCFKRVYSFDRADCMKYGLKFLPSVYTSDFMLEGEKSLYDIIFLGSEKGRYEYLSSIYNTFDELGLRQMFHVFSKNEIFLEKEGLKCTDKRMTYSEYLEYVKKTRAILDMPQPGQAGFTIRVVESLFLKKKLITTCTDIKNYKIYNPNNMFIIGEDDISRIYSFLDSDYEDYPDELLNYYDLETWAANACEGVHMPEGV